MAKRHGSESYILSFPYLERLLFLFNPAYRCHLVKNVISVPIVTSSITFLKFPGLSFMCICLYGSICLSAQCQNILLCPDISLNQIQVYRYGYTSIDLWGNMIEQSVNIPVHIFSVPLPGATFSFLQNVSLNFMLTCVRRGAYDRPLVSYLFSSQGQEVLVPVHGMIIFQFFLSLNSS